MKVLLLTDYRGIVPQRIQEYEGYDLARLTSCLATHGYEVDTIGCHEDRLWSSVVAGRTAAIYASSQHPQYVQYLRAVLSNLQAAGVTLVPSFDHALAHEDKVYQALRMRLVDVPAPRSWAFGYIDHVRDFLAQATFPLVWKRPDGWGSSGVRLVHSAEEGLRIARRELRDRVLVANRPLVRRAVERVVFRRGIGRVLFQELIPHCRYDWKVLIWGDKACGLKRFNRPDDFRASGSGLFEFAPVPDAVLELAWRAQEALKLPWASLDILVQEVPGGGERLFLAEYQAVHFGLTTALKGSFSYVRGADGWQRVERPVDVEAAMADALARVWPLQ